MWTGVRDSKGNGANEGVLPQAAGGRTLQARNDNTMSYPARHRSGRRGGGLEVAQILPIRADHNQAVARPGGMKVERLVTRVFLVDRATSAVHWH